MKLTLLAAADLNWGIGIDGHLPWHVPEDLARFRERTMGKCVVMGRRTFQGLPGPLPGRDVMVLSRTPTSEREYDLDRLLVFLSRHEDEVIVAGGADVYRALLPFCTSAEITRIRGVYLCDTRLVDLSLHGWEISSTKQLCGAAFVETWRPPHDE